ncbi:MAG: DUF1552 domain-containing protein [Myxococcaceae bacterium]|nr:DUF1552 domain-containing protein [Myxococcaceae bacterium]
MKTLFRLHRRAVLKGLGGAVVGLPLLEAMLDVNPALAQSAAAKRYMVFFDGQSMGADGDTLHNDFVPDTVGPDYDLKSAVAPLGAMKSEVSIISGLRIPTASENGGTVPSGGRRDAFHVSSMSPLLAGVRSPSNTACAGPTSDQVMAALLGKQSLVYRVQADWYLSVAEPAGRDVISFKRDSSNRVVPIISKISPQQEFNALFSQPPSMTDPVAAAKADRERRARASVLDLVKGDTQRLLGKLGAGDRVRMQRHLDEIRALELRIAASGPTQTGICQTPGDPGPDPSSSGNQGTDSSGSNTYNQNLGYSGEEERARHFCDLIHMAMACDLARTASLQMTMFQSHLSMYNLTGQATDCHELGHGGVSGGTMAVSKGIAWHVKHFTYLLQKFKDTPEGNGNMLDNMAIVYALEGGHGHDPGGAKDNSSHSTENMAMMLAGRAGGLKPGQHVVAQGKHPANVLVTAMKAVGYASDTLGEVSGDISQLRG